MIRLRRTLERGCAHPVFGPILFGVVVLLLALLLLHAAHTGAVSELGAFCVGIAAFVGSVLLARTFGLVSEPRIAAGGGRGPPRSGRPPFLRPVAAATGTRNLPLRR